MFTWIKELFTPEYETKSGFLRDSNPLRFHGDLEHATLRIYPNGTHVVYRLGELYEVKPKEGSTSEFELIHPTSDYKEFVVAAK